MVGSPCGGGNQVTNWSFEHGAEARAALRSIVSDPEYGPTALSNVRVMSDVLPRLLRGASLERSVLVTAAKESMASTMLNHVSDGMDPILAVRLSANFLAAISAVRIEACYWVAAELALALGLISAEQADELGSGGKPAPTWSSATPPTVIGSRPQPQDGEPDVAMGVPAAIEERVADDHGDGAGQGAQPEGARPAPGDYVMYGVQPGAHPTQRPPLPVGAAYAAPGTGGRQPVAIPDDWIGRVVRETVHPGLLAFNPPAEMQQGRAERIEVGIARARVA
jgi:hypothetical protein